MAKSKALVTGARGRGTFKGLPIIPAKEPLVVHLQQRDIDGATPKDAKNCAYARAIKRECKAVEVIVRPSRTLVRTNNTNWQCYHTSQAMLRELCVFDRGGEMAPGDYRLARIQASKRRGKTQGSNTNRSGRGGPKRQAPRQIPNIRIGPYED